MGIGHFQGGTRVPPDHRQGGEGGELYSKGLWKTLNFEPQTSNLEPRTLNSRAKLPQATPKRRENAEGRKAGQSKREACSLAVTAGSLIVLTERRGRLKS
jgi:hypothetical protein